MASNSEKPSDSERTFSFTLKEILVTAWFILTLGVSIGGFLKIVGDVEGLSTKVDNLTNKVNNVALTNAQLLVLVKGKDAIRVQ